MPDPSSPTPDPTRPHDAEADEERTPEVPPEADGVLASGEGAVPGDDSPEEHLELKDVKGRAVRATGALMSRQIVVRGVNFIGLIILAKILDPATFGLFAVVRFIVMFLQRFSDFGLSATLIRKQDAVTEAELKTVFTIQQAIVAVSFVLLWFGTDVIVGIYPVLNSDHVWLIRVLAFSLVLASLKTMPTVLIQRALRHDKLAIIDVVEVIAYFGVTVGLAVMGYGIWALIWGTLARGVIGTVWLLAIAWWRPRFGFDRTAAKEVLAFGVPIQLASLAGLANESVVPIMVFAFFGDAAVGFANWARTMLASAVGQPLILMGKVQMRVFGRIQDDKKKLVRAVERNISLGALLVFFSATLLVAQGEAFVRYIIEPKWLPALPILYVLTPGFLLRVVGNSYQQALKALGEGVTMFVNALVMFVGQAAGIWLFASTTTGPFWESLIGQPVGLISYAIATTIAQALVVMHAAHRLHRYIRPRWWSPLFAPSAASLASGAAMWALLQAVPSIWMMVPASVIGFAVYGLVLGLIAGERLSKDVADVLGAIGKGNHRIKQVASGAEKLLIALQVGGKRKTAKVPG